MPRRRRRLHPGGGQAESRPRGPQVLIPPGTAPATPPHGVGALCVCVCFGGGGLSVSVCPWPCVLPQRVPGGVQAGQGADRAVLHRVPGLAPCCNASAFAFSWSNWFEFCKRVLLSPFFSFLFSRNTGRHWRSCWGGRWTQGLGGGHSSTAWGAPGTLPLIRVNSNALFFF